MADLSGKQIAYLDSLHKQHVSDVELAIKAANTEHGRYRGAVVEDMGARVVQNQGKGTAVSHEKERLDGEVKVGQKVEIGYEGGKGMVRLLEIDKAQENER